MNNKALKYFAGKPVNVIMKSIKGSQQLPDGTIMRGNVVIEGILLDEDDRYFYLGESQEEVTDALAKNDIVRMNLSTDNFEEFVIEMEEDSEKH